MQVCSKRQMYELLEAGAFGNRWRTWRTDIGLIEAIADGYDGFIAIRCLDKPGQTFYSRRPIGDGMKLAAKLRAAGYTPIYCEPSPDEFVTIQGEVCQTDTGLYLRYSKVKDNMRVAMQQSLHAWGIAARDILRQHLWESSLADLDELFDFYPSAIIEFTVYSIAVGCWLGRNWVVWEVRTTY